MIASFIDKDTRDISDLLLDSNKRLILHPVEFYKQFKWEEIRHFCHKNARYGLPTVELIEFLSERITHDSTIEIGAGSGDLGYYLLCPMTDSKMQEDPQTALTYKLMQQPVITYPKNVEKIDAISAIEKYKPKTVIGSWITALGDPDKETYGCNIKGVDEQKILEMVDQYILIGNLRIHGDKPIMALPHQEIIFDGLLSRSSKPEYDRIFIWSKENV